MALVPVSSLLPRSNSYTMRNCPIMDHSRTVPLDRPRGKFVSPAASDKRWLLVFLTPRGNLESDAEAMEPEQGDCGNLSCRSPRPAPDACRVAGQSRSVWMATPREPGAFVQFGSSKWSKPSIMAVCATTLQRNARRTRACCSAVCANHWTAFMALSPCSSSASTWIS